MSVWRRTLSSPCLCGKKCAFPKSIHRLFRSLPVFYPCFPHPVENRVEKKKFYTWPVGKICRILRIFLFDNDILLLFPVDNFTFKIKFIHIPLKKRWKKFFSTRACGNCLSFIHRKSDKIFPQRQGRWALKPENPFSEPYGSVSHRLSTAYPGDHHSKKKFCHEKTIVT